MYYSVEIERSMQSLAYCINRVNNRVDDIDDWDIRINACGIDYGIYFNFNIEDKELEIGNFARYDEFYLDEIEFYLDEIIDLINEQE